MKALILTLILLGLTLHSQVMAQDLEPLGKAKSEMGSIYLFKGSYDGLETLVVAKSMKDDNANYISGESSMESLIKVFPLQFKGSEKIYIVSVWTKGVHGEQVRILDPALEKMEIARFKSAWSVDLQLEGNTLIMKGKGDAVVSETKSDENYQEYAEISQTWSPSP